MKPPSRRAVRRAIAIIEDSKRSHVGAIREPDNWVGGDESFHALCIVEYDEVLKVLRRMQKSA